MQNKIYAFTLLEILIVVVIIGILASLGIPQYQRTVEKTKGSEAVANLNILRGAEMRYYKENGFETGNFGDLDVEDPNIYVKHFGYTVAIGTRGGAQYDGRFTFKATRRTGMYRNLYLQTDENANFTGDWPFLP